MITCVSSAGLSLQLSSRDLQWLRKKSHKRQFINPLAIRFYPVALGHSMGYYAPAEHVSARNLAFSYCHRLRRSFDVRYRVDIPCGALKYNSVLLARSMNVLTNCKKCFETEEAWEPFLRGFKACVFAKTEEFEDIVSEWKEEFWRSIAEIQLQSPRACLRESVHRRLWEPPRRRTRISSSTRRYQTWTIHYRHTATFLER